MVVVAVDADQLRTVDLGVENLGGLEIGGHEDVALEPQARGLGGDGVGQVAGRRATYRVEAEDLRVGQRDRDHAILEAQRGQADGVVLDVEIAGADALGQPRGAKQRRPAGGSGRQRSRRARAAGPGSATCCWGPVQWLRG